MICIRCGVSCDAIQLEMEERTETWKFITRDGNTIKFETHTFGYMSPLSLRGTSMFIERSGERHTAGMCQRCLLNDENVEEQHRRAARTPPILWREVFRQESPSTHNVYRGGWTTISDDQVESTSDYIEELMTRMRRED